MREKYRSAVYVFNEEKTFVEHIISELQVEFEDKIITMVLPFKSFRLNEEQLNYYQRNKNGVFCERYINPKLQMLQKQYADYFQQIWCIL